jgi:trimeric autotransporter adhesin
VNHNEHPAVRRWWQGAAALLLAAVSTVAGAQPSQWAATTWGLSTCSGCHGSPADMQSWPTNSLSQLAAGTADSGFVTRLLVPNVATMNNLANNRASDGVTFRNNSADRQALLSYLLTVRDGGVSGTSFAFGRVNVNTTSAAQTLVITNERSRDMTWSVSSLSGSGFSVTPSSGTCAANSTCSLSVTFTPPVDGAVTRNPTLTLGGTGGDPSGLTRTLTLTGSGNRAPTAVPGASASTVVTGTTVTLSGNGTDPDGDTISSYSWSLSRPGGSAAVLSPSTASRNPSFVADVAGTYTATLVVNDGLASSAGVGVSVTANPPTPVYQASPSTISDFSGRINVDTPTRDVTISNAAGATGPLTLTSITFPAGPFTRDAASTCSNGTVLASAGSSCLLRVRFTPTAAGPAAANVSVVHSASGSPSTIALSGTGTQSLVNPTTATLAFGNAEIGVPAAAQTVTVGNTGTATLNFSADPRAAAAITGTGAADYSVTGGTCSFGTPVAAGGSCTLTVRFTASAVGSRPAELRVDSDATNGPLRVTLGGTGVALAEPTVVVSGGDFPDTVIGQSSAPTTRTLTITNARTRAVNYTLPTLADYVPGGYTPAGCAASGGTGQVAGGGSCAITYTFQPQAAGGEGSRAVNFSVTFTGTLGDANPTPKSAAFAGRALLPLLVPTATQSFSTTLGTPQVQSQVLTNRSAAPLTLASVALGGAAAADYAFDTTNACTSGTVLAAGATCTLALRFAPTVVGTRDASVTITHAATGSPQTVVLNGTAAPAPQGRLELSAQSLTFADTQLAASSTQTLTLQNAGNLALNFSAFTRGGAASADYTTGGTCAVGTPLAIGASCTLSVSFTPSALGTRSATLTITSDGSNATPVVSLTGTGVPVPAPRVGFVAAADPLDFGSQTVGGLYPAQPVRVVNSGTANLVVSAVAVQGAAFVSTDAAACVRTLAPGEGCDLTVRFAPSAEGAATGQLLVTSNAAGSPQALALRGNGVAFTVPALRWQPAVGELDFGNVSAGNLSAVQTATLVNDGPGGATVTLVNAVGPDGVLFPVVGGSCTPGTVLLAGGSCTVQFRFAPTAAGARSATAQVASTGSVPPTLRLVGAGFGGPTAELALSVPSLAFPATRLGARSAPLDLVLTSNGAGALRVGALAATGPFTLASGDCPPTPFTLAPGSRCTVSVSFTPAAEGAANGRLTITSDAASGATREVALSGDGEAEPELSSGGCSIVRGDRAATDPTLWLLLAGAIAALAWRRRGRR